MSTAFPRLTPQVHLPDGADGWYKRNAAHDAATKQTYEGVAYWVDDIDDLSEESYANTWLAFFPEVHVLEEWEDGLDAETLERHIFSLAVIHDDGCHTRHPPGNHDSPHASTPV